MAKLNWADKQNQDEITRFKILIQVLLCIVLEILFAGILIQEIVFSMH